MDKSCLFERHTLKGIKAGFLCVCNAEKTFLFQRQQNNNRKSKFGNPEFAVVWKISWKKCEKCKQLNRCHSWKFLYDFLLRLLSKQSFIEPLHQPFLVPQENETSSNEVKTILLKSLSFSPPLCVRTFCFLYARGPPKMWEWGEFFSEGLKMMAWHESCTAAPNKEKKCDFINTVRNKTFSSQSTFLNAAQLLS